MVWGISAPHFLLPYFLNTYLISKQKRAVTVLNGLWVLWHFKASLPIKVGVGVELGPNPSHYPLKFYLLNLNFDWPGRWKSIYNIIYVLNNSLVAVLNDRQIRIKNYRKTQKFFLRNRRLKLKSVTVWLLRRGKMSTGIFLVYVRCVMLVWSSTFFII